MKKRRTWKYLLLGLLLPLFLAGCARSEPTSYKRDFFAMDTYITCQVIADDQERAAQGLEEVEKAFTEIDRLTNRFDQYSEISVVNASAGIAPVKVSHDVFAIIQTALSWSDKTEGSFNILIGGVMDCWGFGSARPRVPSAQEITEALSKTDYRKIVLNADQSTVFLPEQGMVLDLGGVAKGYATDKAVAALKGLGLDNALINAGGNVYALGNKAPGTFWKVGVQDPQNPQGIAAVLKASDGALVSSGDYQRFFEAEGVRYHHIIDPVTGFPARASAGTTVIMQSAAAADILSTALFVKGPVKGIELAESFQELDAAMIITKDGGRFGTNSLPDYLVEP